MCTMVALCAHIWCEAASCGPARCHDWPPFVTPTLTALTTYRGRRGPLVVPAVPRPDTRPWHSPGPSRRGVFTTIGLWPIHQCTEANRNLAQDHGQFCPPSHMSHLFHLRVYHLQCSKCLFVFIFYKMYQWETKKGIGLYLRL